MKYSKPLNPLVVVASAIVFVDVALPLLNELLEFVSIKLNKYTIHDQIELIKVSNLLEESPAHAIGFRIDDVDEDGDYDE